MTGSIGLHISVSESAIAIDITSIIYNIDNLYKSYTWPLSCAHEQKSQ